MQYPNSYLKALAYYIKKRRIDSKISLNRFCFENELESAALSRFENSKQQILISTLIKIAKGFDQTPSQFLADFEKELMK